jgi:hypothetical protein
MLIVAIGNANINRACIRLPHCSFQRHPAQSSPITLDEELPPRAPIPPMAKIQVAIEGVVADVTKLAGYVLKMLIHAGTWPPPTTARGSCRPRATSPAHARPPLQPKPRDRPRHGKRHDRRQRFSFPRALRQLAVRERQAAARRDQAARHGQQANRPTSSTASRWPSTCASACAPSSGCATPASASCGALAQAAFR